METFGKTFLRHKQEKKKKKNIASRYLVVYNLNTRSFPPLSTSFIKKIFITKAFVSLLFEKKRLERAFGKEFCQKKPQPVIECSTISLASTKYDFERDVTNLHMNSSIRHVWQREVLFLQFSGSFTCLVIKGGFTNGALTSAFVAKKFTQNTAKI